MRGGIKSYIVVSVQCSEKIILGEMAEGATAESELDSNLKDDYLDVVLATKENVGGEASVCESFDFVEQGGKATTKFPRGFIRLRCSIPRVNSCSLLA